MVRVLVERVLPPALANRADQGQLARMHVRIAIIGLVRILGRIVGVHQVGHRAAVNQKVGRVIGLGWDLETASRGSGSA